MKKYLRLGMLNFLDAIFVLLKIRRATGSISPDSNGAKVLPAFQRHKNYLW